MGRFSLEFGRKGPEGLNVEHDEGIVGGANAEDDVDTKKIEDIKKMLDDLEATQDDDFEDCKKDFSKKLAELMSDDEEIDEYYNDCGKEESLEEAQKEIDKLKSEIEDIFG